MTYIHNDYSLIEAEDNAMNYILLKSLDAGTYTVIDWDLSESEIDKLKEKFENDELTDADIQEDGAIYDSFESVQEDYNGFTIIA